MKEYISNKQVMVCCLETTGLLNENKNNILLELSLINILKSFDNEQQVYTSLNKPESPLTIEAMAQNDIHELDLEKAPNYNRSVAYKTLQKFTDLEVSNHYLIVNNIEFTAEVLQRADINVSNLKIIDIKQVITYLHNNINTLSTIPFLENLSLNYLRYYFNLEHNIRIFKDNHFKNKKVPVSMNKAIIIFYLLEYVIKHFNLSLEELVKITSENIILKKLKIHNDFVKSEDLEDKELLFLSKKAIDKNVLYTCEQLLLERGIEVNKNLITSGKFEGMYVENIEDIEYLEWVLKNMTFLEENLLKAIQKQIDNLINKKYTKNEFVVNLYKYNNEHIFKGKIPYNIKQWLKTRPYIEVKYDEIKFIFTKDNRADQELIINRLKSNIEIIKIEDFTTK